MRELPVWAQRKVRKILRETERKGIPVMQWNKVLRQCHMQLGEKQNVSNELGDLPNKNSKQSANVATWFLLNAYSKMRRKKLRERLLNKRRACQDLMVLRILSPSRQRTMLKLRKQLVSKRCQENAI